MSLSWPTVTLFEMDRSLFISNQLVSSPTEQVLRLESACKKFKLICMQVRVKNTDVPIVAIFYCCKNAQNDFISYGL